MADPPFDVQPHRFESGRWAQYVTIQNPESDRSWGLYVCTVESERDAMSMSTSLRAMLQRAFDAGRVAALVDSSEAGR